ncbi:MULTISPECIES: CoA pyrophosphatase [unclassified Acinetobacter]|uniref:CoA pyrophosphatase n=1 Tax=unclassified Acinetobacter TaxID=196816 RepID=UPI0029340F37|nr:MULTISPECIES: CoA pyrophosphatase [unclassified Acinetobacter]WOE31329.1 CoA pyrophosphatase [Acinetobacter sp. SAAs470]WOE39525.1 CoA pyrophosphatase [Acinetobacter sp. SAAs474]
MSDGSLTQLLQQRLTFEKQAQDAQAAVLIAITDETDPKVLLTRRSIMLNHHAGEVSFPGGKRDPNDSSNIVVALREAQEETALNPFDVRLMGDLPMQKAKNGMTVKPIVGLISPDVQLIAQPTEIDRIFFASLQRLMDAPTMPYEVQYAQQKLYFPSFQIENEVVWGLTARMLVSLFDYGLDYQKEWPLLLAPIDAS